MTCHMVEYISSDQAIHQMNKREKLMSTEDNRWTPEDEDEDDYHQMFDDDQYNEVSSFFSIDQY